jgi:cathepsin L
MTPAEFKAYIGRGYSNGGKHMAAARASAQRADLESHVPVSALPASLDWRTKGVVTAVKDQGGCGGCWSFSAAETLESHIAIQTGKLFTFSEQEILACTPNPNQCGGTGGCSGATQELAFGYVSQAGIVTEQTWPYEGVSGTCNWAGKKPVANITGYVFLPQNNYSALMNAVVTNGPIAISAAAEPWMSYSEGVFDTNCGADVDHAIVLEGYGHDASANEDYYLVRNSWGESWGEAGYIRIKRFGDGKEPCLTDKTPGDGDGCKGGPSSEQVCGWCGILSDSSYPVGGHLL